MAEADHLAMNTEDGDADHVAVHQSDQTRTFVGFVVGLLLLLSLVGALVAPFNRWLFVHERVES